MWFYCSRCSNSSFDRTACKYSNAIVLVIQTFFHEHRLDGAVLELGCEVSLDVYGGGLWRYSDRGLSRHLAAPAVWVSVTPEGLNLQRDIHLGSVLKSQHIDHVYIHVYINQVYYPTSPEVTNSAHARPAREKTRGVLTHSFCRGKWGRSETEEVLRGKGENLSFRSWGASHRCRALWLIGGIEAGDELPFCPRIRLFF